MENDEAVNEFQTIKFSLKEFSEAKFKVFEDIRAIQIEIKVVQQRAFRLRKEIQEVRTRYYGGLVLHYDQLRKRILELSGFQLEISSLRSRYKELTAILHAKNQESESQIECLKTELASRQNESAEEHARKMEEKRRQLERELSALRSDLAGQDEEQMLREQERQHNEELELLRAQIALEMEQEKDTAHNNCQSKVRGLKNQIQEFEAKIDALRKCL